MNDRINNALLRLTKRAEAADRAKLVETFVDTGTLVTLLQKGGEFICTPSVLHPCRSKRDVVLYRQHET